MPSLRETDLYPPVKAFLETQGYRVKGEVSNCDVVAVRGEEAPLVVELKTAFTLPLVFQGLKRQVLTDCVYLAVAQEAGAAKAGLWRRHHRDIRKLCRMLGLGLMLCLALCYYGIRAAVGEFQDATLPDKDLRIANWYMLAVFAGSFVLLAIEFAFRLRRARQIVAEAADAQSKSGF